ncbi:hypothetical protein D8674_012410 [Pyrus ussuriensis x Pyrus communis]|uniref:Uncharacterized protein n=1 Tax=Pyrus ussuriensis x Pyrus communis TaxID=2448454 RepID=A0A5N5G765_9ROSA|nr:hypothetical protein D8674_012410 [Pyrus ussuriensis x Pyrus communis]
MFYVEAFDTAAYWLHHNHPKTLMCNIPSILPVTDVYVEHLKSDMEILKRSFKQSDIDDDERYSLAYEMTDAAGCCLSYNSMDAKTINATLICESIARKFFPRESYPEYQGTDDAQYAEKFENRLRKEVLDPLQKAGSCGRPKKQGKLCEVETYLEEVKADKSKIEPGALLPPQIMAFEGHPNVGEVAELQWKTMVEEMKKQGKMKNCLAVCDNGIKFVRGKATEVLLALGLLVSELTQEPWNGKVVSWHSTLQTIQGHDLKSKSEFVTMTDFEKAFNSILELAVNDNLLPEQMVKKVFVFNKQQFSHERKFEAKGYGDAVPHIVIWFMSDHCFDSEPEKIGMPWTQRGMTMLSGFSENLLKLLLENEGEIGPEHVMKAAISEEKYQKLAVVD